MTQIIDASNCFQSNGVSYGINVQAGAAKLTTKHSFVTKYVYSPGNQTPSYSEWEVLFTIAIIGLGLFLFALLIGNMQNFLQALGRRQLQMSLRRRDVEQWMRDPRLLEHLTKQVREAEQYNRVAIRGVNEQQLLENLPEDLQKVSYVIISLTLCKKEDGNEVILSEGDVYGEELLSWCLEQSSINDDAKKMRILGQRLVSTKLISCITNVEAFTLRDVDIEEVISPNSRFLQNPRVQGALRYESAYWRSLAARCIQVAWRKKRLSK